MSNKSPKATVEDGTLTLRVAEASPKDAGRGVVRLDPADLDRLGAEIGSTLQISGKGVTVARALPAYAEHRDQGLIQMDGILRSNAEAGVDERVTVRCVEVQPARSLTLTPVEQRKTAPGAGQTRSLAQLLDGIAVLAGNQVRVDLFGTRAQTFTVAQTSPEGPVLIGPKTNIRLAGQGSAKGAGGGQFHHLRGHRRPAP